ncbi:hypothetical protein Nepgr_021063 [Nepenthes gracilis]|uniref:Uncharacterized protein n=1 Tax=Nepenthes gracilis TaxID=150966 RepID=A0AAD3SY77_NEPGR|nr:hypothetical protein Nepgr_021063 [Nepenthes gracilis]
MLHNNYTKPDLQELKPDPHFMRGRCHLHQQADCSRFYLDQPWLPLSQDRTARESCNSITWTAFLSCKRYEATPNQNQSQQGPCQACSNLKHRQLHS